jgi:hypothetical protein
LYGIKSAVSYNSHQRLHQRTSIAPVVWHFTWAIYNLEIRARPCNSSIVGWSMERDHLELGSQSEFPMEEHASLF